MPDLHLRLNDDAGGDPPASKPIDPAASIALLERAEITGETLVPWGSNYTFAVALREPDSEQVRQFGIYKPARGERPLWDFPAGTLYRRERSAWLLANLLGWPIVPPTVIRVGPYGVGSLQLYVEPAGEMDENDALDFWGREAKEIERIVLFDTLANNADRKLTHCLLDTHGRTWGIDHGLTFNAVPKLRTALWQFVGKQISTDLRDEILGVREDETALRDMFAELLSGEEVDALVERFDRLLAWGCHPALDPSRNIPYGWW
jgi:uncharacterized repeat protein (TIGR03843 family)